MNFILLAIPFFLLLIALELMAEKIRGTHYYRINDAISSLSAGVVSRATGVIKLVIPLSMYSLCYQYIAVFEFPASHWGLVLAFVAYDFFYYWNHRMGHEMNLFWASHVVHHSSEEYNLTTALRQTSGSVFNWIFFVPLAVLGIPPETLFAIAALNLIYQFWVHSRHIPKLGFLEWFMVTPSNHRVHHAQNQVYIDKNYGGVFIIWDRIFGTFQQELADEKPIYGIRKALNSWDPVRANLQVYWQLLKDCWYTQLWRDKLLIWFKPTGWRPEDVQQKYPLTRVDLSRFQKFDTPIGPVVKYYALFQHLVVMVITFAFLLNLSGLLLWQKMLIAGFIIYSCHSVATVLEARPHGIYLEAVKHCIVFAGTFFMSAYTASVSLILIGVVSLFWLLKIKAWYESPKILEQSS